MPSIFGTEPDYRRLLTVLQKQEPDRVPVYEFFSDTSVQERAIGEVRNEPRLPLGGRPDCDPHIRCQYLLGYDYLSPGVGFGFSTRISRQPLKDASGFDRNYVDDRHAPIKDRHGFETFDWPTPEEVSYELMEYCAAHLPEGMKLVANLGGGLLEWAMWLVGAEDFCLMVYDDPDLVREIITRINDQQVAVARQAASHPDVIACALGDDMGFKTQTFLPPEALRELIFPGLRRIADAVHAEGKAFILHSCGNLTLVMDDLIEMVGIDAKHSFEDVIMPVTEVKRRWGGRVAILGGVDVDVLCTADEPRLRAYVRDIVQQCGPGGGFALGSGNSIANYIPPANLRVMLGEAFRCQGVAV